MKPKRVFCRSCNREFKVHEVAYQEYYVELSDGGKHLHPIVDTDEVKEDECC